eukprot:TRINITY_DN4307_c0_g1_i2.p1 TRINITY_DN4307_c0_g1~~TRINITY_DN4307_c0_g1_i2.p1  ORF type:complete len:130 (-),score=37.09 TRINITY_DN4307_c0_g1_i2:252-641(-)
MTDEEVIEEKRRLGDGFKEKGHMKFLQKYYHKGAFFSEELKTLETNHDWLSATGEDKFTDRTLLPAVMQVKNFGRAGRTKYTHLKNEDTSKPDDPWSNSTTNTSYINKLAGTKPIYDRPTKKRKLDQIN